MQETLSDLNGTDPYIHRGTMDGVVRAILEVFHRPGRPVPYALARLLVRRLARVAREIKRRWGGDLFRIGAFDELVYTAHRLAATGRGSPLTT